MCGGYPAKGYSASVTITSSGNPQVEGVNYWLLAYSGMVLYQDNEGVNRNITCFEYIGKKLNKTLSGGVGGGVLLEALAIKQGKILDSDIVAALAAIDPDLAQMNHTIVKVTIADETDEGEEVTGQLDPNNDYVLWNPAEVPSGASMPSTVNVALSLSSAE